MIPAAVRGWEVLGSVRARLMVLLAIAAIPLVAMAALVAWQNYEMTIARAMQVVVLARETAGARHEAALEGVRQMLAAVSQASAARTDRTELCDVFLADILALNREHYGNLIVVRTRWPRQMQRRSDPRWSHWRPRTPRNRGFRRFGRSTRLTIGPVRSSGRAGVGAGAARRLPRSWRVRISSARW